jgi:hypothetical protein
MSNLTMLLIVTMVVVILIDAAASDNDHVHGEGPRFHFLVDLVVGFESSVQGR